MVAKEINSPSTNSSTDNIRTIQLYSEGAAPSASASSGRRLSTSTSSSFLDSGGGSDLLSKLKKSITQLELEQSTQKNLLARMSEQVDAASARAREAEATSLNLKSLLSDQAASLTRAFNASIWVCASLALSIAPNTA